MITTEDDSTDSSQNLIPLIKQLIVEKHYGGVLLLFKSVTNVEKLKEIASEVIHEICLIHLTDENYCENRELYSCAEKLFQCVAQNAKTEEVLLELLEIIEENKTEQLFISALKALQIVLLRQNENRARALEWSLNSIVSRIQELPVPEYITNGYDEKQEKLLELDGDVVKLLMNYITITMFYEPILKELTSVPRPSTETFKSTAITRRNVLCCFLVQLLGKPFSQLDLTRNDQKTNTYTMQCADTLVSGISKILVDVFFLLGFVEQRVRWKRKYNDEKGVYEMSSNNIFLIEEKLPLDALAIYYYLVLVEKITLDQAPKVYSPLYIFESCLYLVSELFASPNPSLQLRGLLLAHQVIDDLRTNSIPIASLELNVHKSFCTSLCQITGFGESTRNRQSGVALLRKYILQFDHAGRYLVLKNLLSSIRHSGLVGFLTTIYKDLVAAALVANVSNTLNNEELPSSYTGVDFRSIMLESICHLADNTQTNLLDHNHHVISALNAIRFFALKDIENKTGFWDISDDIENDFLKTLRVALDMSVAHFQAEYVRVKTGVIDETPPTMLNLSVLNGGGFNFEMGRPEKLEILNRSICEYDLMKSLLARTCECIEIGRRKIKRDT